MEIGKNYIAKPSYRFLSGEGVNPINSESMFEFDESEEWNSNQVASHEFKKSVRHSRVWTIPVKRIDDGDEAVESAKSLPVNIPDWSKILREDHRDNRRRENDEDEDVDEEENKIPPHEFLARQFARSRIGPFSVYEGIGRTLKGRDLNKVRDAIWEKTGFED